MGTDEYRHSFSLDGDIVTYQLLKIRTDGTSQPIAGGAGSNLNTAMKIAVEPEGLEAEAKKAILEAIRINEGRPGEVPDA